MELAVNPRFELSGSVGCFIALFPESPIVIDGVVAGAWIKETLGNGPSPFVKGQIPNIYEAYLRLFHPVHDLDGHRIRWAEVADSMGRTAHRQMQWHKIVGAREAHSLAGSSWPGSRPALGELEPQTLRVLCANLKHHTKETANCFFGLSTIYGGVEEIAEGKPLLKFPHREFVVLSGPLSAVTKIGVPPTAASFSTGFSDSGDSTVPSNDPSSIMTQSPNLIWPADRAWYVASEFDFDSTLVGGSKDLIDELTADPRLETLVVHPNDSLAANADKINVIDDDVS